MADRGVKRKAESHDSGPQDTRAKTKKPWRVPRKSAPPSSSPRNLAPGDSGIWATCDKGREGKCTAELRDLFDEYAREIYGDGLRGAVSMGGGDGMGSAGEGEGDGGDDLDGGGGIDDGEAESLDIESAIKAEVSSIKKPLAKQFFTAMRVDVQCVIFLKTLPPIHPVDFVERICADALANPHLKRTRFARRLSPMTLMGRATEEGLAKVAKEVLRPHFHQEPVRSKSFAIRPNIRNNHLLGRDAVIKQVASMVGPGHKVDLKNYDVLIIVEVYQNICGMSVVGRDFERLKRYNLAEIFNPTVNESNGGETIGKASDQ